MSHGDILTRDTPESQSSLVARYINPRGNKYLWIYPQQLQVTQCEVYWQSISQSWPRREAPHSRKRQKTSPKTFHFFKAYIYLLPETTAVKSLLNILFYVTSITYGIKIPSPCNTISICNLRPPNNLIWSWGHSQTADGIQSAETWKL